MKKYDRVPIDGKDKITPDYKKFMFGIICPKCKILFSHGKLKSEIKLCDGGYFKPANPLNIHKACGTKLEEVELASSLYREAKNNTDKKMLRGLL